MTRQQLLQVLRSHLNEIEEAIKSNLDWRDEPVKSQDHIQLLQAKATTLHAMATLMGVQK